MNTISTDQAKELIRETNGKIFSSTFIKKDNTIRTLTARLGKRYKSKTGKAAPYKAKEYNLLPVYDMSKKAFRMLNFNTLLTLTINKNKYNIEQVSHFCTDEEGNNIII
mgnify:CR=1 FL=1|tara:strand:- start:1107 stop:1433 length:327 start_codon:yes stop_codon:yes gene_type:complete